MSQFDDDHAPGGRALTASRWPALVLPVDARPRWLPSPYALALHMTGAVPFDDGETALLRRGKLLEPVGARLAVEDHGLEIVAEQERVERADIPALAWIDIATKTGRLELKVVNHRAFEASWQGRPPLYPRTQAQAQMAITGDEMCYVGAIVIGYAEIRLELFAEQRHEGMVDLLLDRADDFMTDLRAGRLPLPDESESSYAAWAATARFDKGATALLAEPEAVERARRWRQARADLKAAQATDDASRMWFSVNAPQDAECIELLDGTVIKRTASERRGYTVAPSRTVTWKLENK